MRSEANNPRSEKSKVGAVILCAGKGERTGLEYNKILYCLGRKTVLETVLDKFSETEVDRIAVVISEDDESSVKPLIEPYSNAALVYGGATRTESVHKGLIALSDCDIAVIHDGARPFVSSATISASIDSAKKYGSGIAAVKSIDTVKQAENGVITHSLDRSVLYNIQTPQTFRYDEIVKAYETVKGVFTDDSELYAQAGFVPHIVDGSYDNYKITTADDLVRSSSSSSRIGIGYDIHRLVRGRPLILGGINVPHSKGLLGHSDADVLVHAVMDAMLSAADLPDIGVLFPDTDDSLLGASSMVLLERTLKLIRSRGYGIGCISAVIIAQEPKLAPHINDIRENLASALCVDRYGINISATTSEHLGQIGKGKAIAAYASCMLTVDHD